MQPVCVKCERGLKCKRNGVYFVATDHDGYDYELWSSDLWECRGCGVQILRRGTGQEPIASSFEDDFQQKVEAAEKISGGPIQRSAPW